MTDRIRTLTVILDHDVRTDDAEVIIAAIRALRGVEDVVAGPPVGSGSDGIFAREIAKVELRRELLAVLHPHFAKDSP